MNMDLPPLAPGSDTAIALHRIWNGTGEAFVRTAGVEESAAEAAVAAAHLGRRTDKQVTIWSLHLVEIRGEIDQWFTTEEVSVGQPTTKTLVRLDLPPHLIDYEPGDVTIIVSEGWNPNTRAVAAIDIGTGCKTIRLLTGAHLGDEPFDIAIAGSV